MLQPENSTTSPPERSLACRFAFSADDHSVTSGLSLAAAARQRDCASGTSGACARGNTVSFAHASRSIRHTTHRLTELGRLRMPYERIRMARPEAHDRCRSSSVVYAPVASRPEAASQVRRELGQARWGSRGALRGNHLEFWPYQARVSTPKPRRNVGSGYGFWLGSSRQQTHVAEAKQASFDLTAYSCALTSQPPTGSPTSMRN